MGKICQVHFFAPRNKAHVPKHIPRCYIIYKHIPMLYYIQTLKWVRLLPLAGEKYLQLFYQLIEKNFSYFF